MCPGGNALSSILQPLVFVATLVGVYLEQQAGRRRSGRVWQVYLMFLNKSLPKLKSCSWSNFDFSSLSSGIIGGGGPIDFRSSTGVVGLSGMLARFAESLLLNLLNHPLDRFAFLGSAMLEALRLGGRPCPPSAACSSPFAYALFKRPRLKSRRILPGRLDKVGDVGLSSAGLFEPVVKFDELDFGDVASALSLVVTVSLPSSFGVSGGVGTGASTGDGRGGGISVPSVREPNLNSSAGSSKRLAGTGAVGFVVELVLDGIVMAQKKVCDRAFV